MTTLTVPDHATVAAALSDPPVFSVSIIQTKPGKFDEFVALQHAQFMRVRGQVQGVRGSRMLKSPAKGVVVLISSFDTAQDAERFPPGPALHRAPGTRAAADRHRRGDAGRAGLRGRADLAQDLATPRRSNARVHSCPGRPRSA
jgi:hypothetical protein